MFVGTGYFVAPVVDNFFFLFNIFGLQFEKIYLISEANHLKFKINF